MTNVDFLRQLIWPQLICWQFLRRQLILRQAFAAIAVAAMIVVHSTSIPAAAAASATSGSSSPAVVVVSVTTGQLFAFPAGTNPSAGVTPQATVGGPAALALHPTKPLLYVAPEWGVQNGQLLTYSVAQTGSSVRVRLKSKTKLGGTGSVHIAVSPDQTRLLTSHYSSGEISIITLNASGLPVGSTTLAVPKTVTQTPAGVPPRVHWSAFIDNETALVTDVTSNRVHGLKLAASSEPQFVSNVASDIQQVKGDLARSLTLMSPNRMVLSNEFGAGVACLQRPDAASPWKVASSQRLTEPSKPADVIRLDDNHAVVAVRGPDELALVAVGADCTLAVVDRVPSGGKSPRGLAIAAAPSGNQLLVGHEGGGLRVFAVEPSPSGQSSPGQPVLRSTGTLFAKFKVWTIAAR